MWLISLLRRLATSTSGTATLEGALVVPIAISLMAGGVEFGQLFSAYGTAAKSMRAAARYLARVPEADICGWGLTNAKNLAVYGKVNPNLADPNQPIDQPLIPNWTTGTVTLQSPGCGGAFPNPVIIELRAAVPYSGFMFAAIGLSNSWTLNVKHQEVSIGE
jgi:TadE-like protein